MKSLLLNSFFILLLSGCTLGHYKQLNPMAEGSRELPAGIFGENFNSFLFKTNLTVYGHDFSGLLVTKQVQPNDYRVIFTTELGMKLFDFEFRDTAFSLHYCIPQFNRPKLLKVIQHDLEILLMNGLKDQAPVRFSEPSSKQTVYRYTSGKQQLYYFIEPASAELQKIEVAKKQVKKSIFTLTDYADNFPKSISIRHYDVKLTISLQLLKR